MSRSRLAVVVFTVLSTLAILATSLVRNIDQFHRINFVTGGHLILVYGTYLVIGCILNTTIYIGSQARGPTPGGRIGDRLGEIVIGATTYLAGTYLLLVEY
jgi:hypothetical protein